MTRRERLERKLTLRAEWAEKADDRAEQRFTAAHNIVKNIPLGQPILVGHHSEKRHRRDIDRMSSNMSKGVEESKLADHHRGAAMGLESALETSVFSDDPDAIESLEARIAANEALRERMKLVNKLYRKGDAPGLEALGLNLDKLRAKIEAIGLSFVKVPYEGYQLSNLGTRIATDRKRIVAIQTRNARQQRAESAGGVAIEHAGEYSGHKFSRVIFAEKPSRDVLAALRDAGYSWGNGAWSGFTDKLPECVARLAEALS